MKIAAQLPKMPRVAIIDTRVPNAFAAGRSPDNAVVAVTVGLLEKLDRDELQGVVAHEVGHIVNRDVLFMTMLGVMVGTIVILADVFLRSVFYSSLAGTRRSSRKEGGGVQIILFVIAIVLAILAPILAQVIYFAASRRREYLADASAAIYTRYPDGLARALEKISRGAGDYKKSKASRVTAPMYIVNPMQARGRSTGLFSTHPDTQERIRILRAMAGGSVGYAEYQAAWKSVDGERAGSLPGSALASGEAQPAREAHPDAKKPPERPFAQVPGMEGQSETAQRVVGGMLAGAGLEVARRQQSQIPMAQKRREERARRHEAADAMRRRQGFRFAECQCGLRFKVAPDYVREQINCPRCGRPNAVQRPNRAQRRKRARR